MRYVIAIHGVESLGEWQEEIAPVFDGIHDLKFIPLKYGRFRVWKVLIPLYRWWAVNRFLKLYNSLGSAPNVSIIAHSFGTWITARALVLPGVSYRNVVFCGSIVAPGYDWRTPFDSGRVRRVRNDVSDDDLVVRLFRAKWLRWLIPRSGQSGIERFNTNLDMVTNHRYALGHSQHFLVRAHCERYWRPVICENEEFAELSYRCVHGPDSRAAIQRFQNMYGSILRRTFVHLDPQASSQEIDGMVKASLVYFIKEGMRGVYAPEHAAMLVAWATLP